MSSNKKSLETVPFSIKAIIYNDLNKMNCKEIYLFAE